jgi:hypothetical protein
MGITLEVGEHGDHDGLRRHDEVAVGLPSIRGATVLAGARLRHRAARPV